MINKRLKVLLIIEQCNPGQASVPLVGYNFFNEISKLVDVSLITHVRNKEGLEKVRNGRHIEYIRESTSISFYYRIIKRLISIFRGKNWPIKHSLTYPVYRSFNHSVYKNYAPMVSENEYDLVHVITPMIPRYPVKIIKACNETPFIIGPVNGGVPFPSGFQDVARKEYAHFNFLRFFSRCIPDYTRTYRDADKILSGSTYTLNMLKDMFRQNHLDIELFFENGIKKQFFHPPSGVLNDRFNILFVGRLVPYKGADMVIEALNSFEDSLLKRLQLTIVGDGPERAELEKRVDELGINNRVHFVGWVDQENTFAYYKNADLFCFPSVREFGGAVVLEAMACGLPCIVADQGGIGEYVTDETGFKIKPLSREYMIKELAERINQLLIDRNLFDRMSHNAFERANEFEWGRKGQKMVDIYREVIELKKRHSIPQSSDLKTPSLNV